jgi:hypothetical protein
VLVNRVVSVVQVAAKEPPFFATLWLCGREQARAQDKAGQKNCEHVPVRMLGTNSVHASSPLVLSERALPIVFAMIRTEHVRKFAHCRKCGAQTTAAPPLRTSRPVHHGRIMWIIHKFSSASFQDRA